jgi:hypothetical protein
MASIWAHRRFFVRCHSESLVIGALIAKAFVRSESAWALFRLGSVLDFDLNIFTFAVYKAAAPDVTFLQEKPRFTVETRREMP